jgi:hypothetical protein
METQFNNCENKTCECGVIFVPVKSVDGVECDVRVEKKQDGTMSLVLETKKGGIREQDDGECYIYNRFPLTTLENFNTFLSSLRFNRIRNQFQTCPLFDWSFLESDTVKVHDKCCVCYERTLTKTTCGHQLCLPCYDKIKYTVDHETPCPMCRTDCNID